MGGGGGWMGGDDGEVKSGGGDERGEEEDGGDERWERGDGDGEMDKEGDEEDGDEDVSFLSHLAHLSIHSSRSLYTHTHTHFPSDGDCVLSKHPNAPTTLTSTAFLRCI